VEADTLRVIVAVAALTLIEVVALCKGKNGFLLRLVIVAIAGLAGFSIAELIK